MRQKPCRADSMMLIMARSIAATKQSRKRRAKKIL